MTKAYFIMLAGHNVWANRLVDYWVEKISEEQWSMPIVSSFNSVADTALHVLGAEHIWLERVLKVEDPQWLPFTFKGSKAEVMQRWLLASEGLSNFVTQLDESDLQKKVYYKRINGEEFEQPLYQILAHVFNHSTYHRGQLVTMIRQTGYTEVTSTDLLSYARLMP